MRSPTTALCQSAPNRATVVAAHTSGVLLMRLRPPLLLLAGATVAAAVIAAPGAASAAPAAASGPTVTVAGPHGPRARSSSPTTTARVRRRRRHLGGLQADPPRPGQGRVRAAAGEIAGVALNGKGTLAYTSTNYASGATALTIKPQERQDAHGRPLDLRADPQPGQVHPVRHRQPDRVPEGGVRAARRGRLPGSGRLAPVLGVRAAGRRLGGRRRRRQRPAQGRHDTAGSRSCRCCRASRP